MSEKVFLINSIKKKNAIELEFENKDLFDFKKKNESSECGVGGLNKKDRKISISIVFAILFFQEFARGIIIPSAPAYTNLIGGLGDAKLLGLVISSFSLGRLIATIGLGLISSSSYYKKIFSFSIIFCIIGSFWYSIAYLDHGSIKFGEISVVASRAVLGFGAGTLSVGRSFITDVTEVADRTSLISLSAATQFLGYAVSPIVGSFLSYIPTIKIGTVRIDYLTSPGWFLVFQNFLLLLVIAYFFKNPKPVVMKKSINGIETNVNNNNSTNNLESLTKGTEEQQQFLLSASSNSMKQLNSYEDDYNGNAGVAENTTDGIFEGTTEMNTDGSPSCGGGGASNNIEKENRENIYKIIFKNKRALFSIIVFILLNFFIRSVLGIYETLGTPLFDSLNSDSIVTDLSTDSISSSNIGSSSSGGNNDSGSGYFFGGLGFIGIFFLLLISWASKKEILHDYWIYNFGNVCVAIGCYIAMTHRLTWTRYMLSYIFVYGIGFPISQTVIVSIFSKVLSNTIGNASQGFLISIITSAGSLGRVVGPLFCGLLYSDANGDQLPIFAFAFAFSVFILIVSLFMIPTEIAKIKYINISGDSIESKQKVPLLFDIDDNDDDDEEEIFIGNQKNKINYDKKFLIK
ncbi:hypothetical protein RB653_005213 [Dictyostelium firmibasis]|uniref:Major facilitator superfamily (MFS) profile domain-containing protein n=1 Tax=Dictyostelium firmibasis TaxID=79012 RepID=A0AAN7U955_9MYCE